MYVEKQNPHLMIINRAKNAWGGRRLQNPEQLIAWAAESGIKAELIDFAKVTRKEAIYKLYHQATILFGIHGALSDMFKFLQRYYFNV